MREIKNKVIDTMITLLEFAKECPIFSVEFEILAPNNSIEEYLTSHIQYTGWDGKLISEDEISVIKKDRIETFRKSDGYNSNGYSTLKMHKLFTLQNIKYNEIFTLVSGGDTNLPDKYQFIGNVSLFNFND